MKLKIFSFAIFISITLFLLSFRNPTPLLSASASQTKSYDYEAVIKTITYEQVTNVCKEELHKLSSSKSNIEFITDGIDNTLSQGQITAIIYPVVGVLNDGLVYTVQFSSYLPMVNTTEPVTNHVRIITGEKRQEIITSFLSSGRPTALIASLSITFNEYGPPVVAPLGCTPIFKTLANQ